MDPVSRGGAQNRAHNVDPDLVPQPGVKKQKKRNDSINLLVPCISSTEQLARPSCGATVCLACPLIPHGMVTCRCCFWVALATAVGYAAFAGPKTGPFFDPKFGSAFFRTGCKLLWALQLLPSYAGPNFGPEYGPSESRRGPKSGP